MNEDVEKDVLETNITKNDILLHVENGEESQVKVSKELRRKVVDEDGRVGESADLTVNMQTEDASISLTKSTTRNTSYDVAQSAPTFKITFEEKTVISLSPTSPSAVCTSLQQETSTCSLDTCGSDAGRATGTLSEHEGKSPPTTDKKALTGHILHEISEVLDKMDLSYINKVRSEFNKQLENKNGHSGKIKDDKLNAGSQPGTDRVGRSDDEGEMVSREDRCAEEDRVSERDYCTNWSIKHNASVCRNTSNDANATSRADTIARKKYLNTHIDRAGKASDKVSFIDKVFSAIETFTPGCHIMSRASAADLDSASSIGSDISNDDDSSVSDSDIDEGTQSDASSSSLESASQLNDQRSSRVMEIKTAIEDKLGIPARNFPIALYFFCFALFYLFWTMCYMSCTYRRTFYGVTRNSNTWYCKLYDSFSKLHRFSSDTSEVQVTYKSNRKHYHPFQPW